MIRKYFIKNINQPWIKVTIINFLKLGLNVKKKIIIDAIKIISKRFWSHSQIMLKTSGIQKNQSQNFPPHCSLEIRRLTMRDIALLFAKHFELLFVSGDVSKFHESTVTRSSLNLSGMRRNVIKNVNYPGRNRSSFWLF